MTPKDQLIKEIEELKIDLEKKMQEHQKGTPPAMIKLVEGLTNSKGKITYPGIAFDKINNESIEQAISTIKSFMKGYKLIKRSVWIEMFIKSHKIKTYQEAIDKLCECYRAWNTMIDFASGDYKMVKEKTIRDMLARNSFEMLPANRFTNTFARELYNKGAKEMEAAWKEIIEKSLVKKEKE